MHDEQGAIQAAKAAGGEGQHSRAQLTQPTAPNLLGCAAKDRHGGGPVASRWEASRCYFSVCQRKREQWTSHGLLAVLRRCRGCRQGIAGTGITGEAQQLARWPPVQWAARTAP